MKSGLLFVFANLFFAVTSCAQNLLYVDQKGVLRFTKTNTEASFFGVNYTVPFAYGFRSHQALGIDPEQAIKNDVYHFARLGLNAFRVHVWDTEITDSLGNLLENEHLRLFDFLIHELKQRNIKIFLTPLAFWGNGYPQPDEKTGSFSSLYSKQQVLVAEPAIRAQERYIKQLLQHTNPYTKHTYGQDSDIIALEINNEPHHSGSKQKVKEYIDRMVQAVRTEGWTKPLFYNISESPSYADVVARSAIDGVSFQWYPTGLVANRTLKGNMLPHVDHYHIPFDTVPEYSSKARMVYEFDAGDVLQSYMYPAMARSFRTAGFQWATQFAYDPMYTAYGNTEYQTHYLNLAYTPSKAISLLIASKVFQKMPRLQSYGAYPADTVFDVFRVSYHQDLSEMNTPHEFYYSNTTTTVPVAANRLQHIAGVGHSAIVRYSGSGAYFLDKIGPGIWRLEVMPDAVPIRDPFAKASPEKEVTRIQWAMNSMEIMLPDLGSTFGVFGLNEGNQQHEVARQHRFSIMPGTYYLTVQPLATGVANVTGFAIPDYPIHSHEFAAPKAFSSALVIAHIPANEVPEGKSFPVAAKIVGLDRYASVMLELRNTAGKWNTVPMEKTATNDYEGRVPAEMVSSGLLQYRIIAKKGDGSFVVSPGHYAKDPYAWDAAPAETWTTWVVDPTRPLPLFQPITDRASITVYNPSWRNNTISYVATEKPGMLALSATLMQGAGRSLMGFQYHIADRIQSRGTAIHAYQKLVIYAGADSFNIPMKILLVTKDARAYAASVVLGTDLRKWELPLRLFKADSFLLLPRPYPGFLPLWFRAAASGPLRLSDVESIQVVFGDTLAPGQHAIRIAGIFLEK